MSNTQSQSVVMGPVAATSVSLALINLGNRSVLMPVLQAPGAAGLLLLVGIKPEGAEEVLKMLSTPMLGDLMLAKMLQENSNGELKPAAEAELHIMYGPQPIDSSLYNLGKHFDTRPANSDDTEEKPTLH